MCKKCWNYFILVKPPHMVLFFVKWKQFIFIRTQSEKLREIITSKYVHNNTYVLTLDYFVRCVLHLPLQFWAAISRKIWVSKWFSNLHTLLCTSIFDKDVNGFAASSSRQSFFRKFDGLTFSQPLWAWQSFSQILREMFCSLSGQDYLTQLFRNRRRWSWAHISCTFGNSWPFVGRLPPRFNFLVQFLTFWRNFEKVLQTHLGLWWFFPSRQKLGCCHRWNHLDLY